jgi:hypothetical protein
VLTRWAHRTHHCANRDRAGAGCAGFSGDGLRGPGILNSPDGSITLTTGGERFARDVAPVLDMLAATGH